MRCSEALEHSPSRSAGSDTAFGRVLVTGTDPQVFLHFIPRLVDSGYLNDAGSVVHEYATISAAAKAAEAG
jgi:hypothetical protein